MFIITRTRGVRAALADRLDDRHVKLYTAVITRAKDMGNISMHRAEAREYTRIEALFAIRLINAGVRPTFGTRPAVNG